MAETENSTCHSPPEVTALSHGLLWTGRVNCFSVSIDSLPHCCTIGGDAGAQWDGQQTGGIELWSHHCIVWSAPIRIRVVCQHQSLYEQQGRWQKHHGFLVVAFFVCLLGFVLW